VELATAILDAEAGIEDAMAHLNYNTTNRTRDNWTLTGTNVIKERALGTNKYKVYLQAEAYFVVTHDAARPFRVHARDAVAHDLGTRFVVRAYAELPRIEVIVAEGAVSLRHERPEADSAILAVGHDRDVGIVRVRDREPHPFAALTRRAPTGFLRGEL